MATHNCPTCGRPTATEYAERHDGRFCSPITSPDCWDWDNSIITNEDTGESWTPRDDPDLRDEIDRRARERGEQQSTDG
jgi:hypothetical protein